MKRHLINLGKGIFVLSFIVVFIAGVASVTDMTLNGFSDRPIESSLELLLYLTVCYFIGEWIDD